MKINKAVICSGGQLGEWTIPFIQQADYLIGADRGAAFLLEHGYTPDIAIGDFDSTTKEQYDEIIKQVKNLLTFDAIDKNYTDTELSLLHALEQGADEIVILGGLGTRFDHSIGNIQLLTLAVEKDVHASIIDEHNCITLIKQDRSFDNLGYTYISLLPFSDEVKGITLTGFKYPLHDATIKKGQCIGISNEFVAASGTVALTSGQLLVIQARD